MRFFNESKMQPLESHHTHRFRKILPLAEKLMRPVRIAAATLVLAAMFNCALAADKPKAPNVPNAKIEVEGWGARISFKNPIDSIRVHYGADEKNFKVSVEGYQKPLIAPGEEAVPFYFPPFFEFSNGLVEVEDSLGDRKLMGAWDLSENVLVNPIYVPIFLTAPLQITVSVSSPLPSGGTKITETETLVPAGKFYRVKKSHITIMMEEPGYERAAKNLVPTINELNSLLPKKDRVRHVIIGSARAATRIEAIADSFFASLCVSPLYELAYSKKIGENEFVIAGTIGMLTDPQFGKIAAFHEIAHAHYLNFGFGDSAAWINDYFYHMAFDSSVGIDPAKNPVMRLFDEGAYYHVSSLPDSIDILGHPHDSANELFASACTVLRFYPDEFFKRLNALNQYDGSSASTAVSIAYNAAYAFGKHRVFPKVVYEKLEASK